MIGRGARAASWLALAVACALPIGTFFFRPVPLPLAAALAGLAALAIARPADALIMLAAFGPLAGAISALVAEPYDGSRLIEMAVLILLAGSCLRAAFSRTAIVLTRFEWALLVCASVAAASAFVQLPAVLPRTGDDGVRSLIDFLARTYFERSVVFAGISQAALLIEGAALAGIAARIVRSGHGERLASAFVAGAAGAAALSVYRLFEVALRRPPLGEGLLQTISGVRISPQYGDVNAAGSYFALAVIIALAGAGLQNVRARLHLAGTALCAIALWLSGSRVAASAALLCGLALLVHRHRTRVFTGLRWRTIVSSAAVVTLAAGALFFLYTDTRHATVGFSVFSRVELLKTGLRMLGDRPLFGVGVSQYYRQFPRYGSAELRKAFLEEPAVPVTNENAHNNFVQIAAELGTLGLATFVVALIFAWDRHFQPADRLRVGIAGGLSAFLLTCLAGHPLLITMVAFPFWIAVGMLAGLAPANAGRASPPVRLVALSVVLLLTATLPLRAVDERRDAYLAGVTIGLSNWQDDDGRRFRWAEQRAAVFVSAEVKVVRIPLRSPDGQARKVGLQLDGKPAGAVIVPPSTWTEAKLVLPDSADAPDYRRIDLFVEVSPGRATAERWLMVGRIE